MIYKYEILYAVTINNYRNSKDACWNKLYIYINFYNLDFDLAKY